MRYTVPLFSYTVQEATQRILWALRIKEKVTCCLYRMRTKIHFLDESGQRHETTRWPPQCARNFKSLTPTAYFLVGIINPLMYSVLWYPRWSTYFIFAEGIIFTEICNPLQRLTSKYTMCKIKYWMQCTIKNLKLNILTHTYTHIHTYIYTQYIYTWMYIYIHIHNFLTVHGHIRC